MSELASRDDDDDARPCFAVCGSLTVCRISLPCLKGVPISPELFTIQAMCWLLTVLLALS